MKEKEQVDTGPKGYTLSRIFAVGGSKTASKLEEKEMELGKSLEGTKYWSARGHEHPLQPRL